MCEGVYGERCVCLLYIIHLYCCSRDGVCFLSEEVGMSDHVTRCLMLTREGWYFTVTQLAAT